MIARIVLPLTRLLESCAPVALRRGPLISPGATTTQQRPRLASRPTMTPEERAFLCQVIPAHRCDLGHGGAGTPPTEPGSVRPTEPQAAKPALEWKPVPAAIACPGGRLRLHGFATDAHFIDGYALSAEFDDGAISGWPTRGPAGGAVRLLHISPEHGGWRLVYCEDEWVS